MAHRMTLIFMLLLLSFLTTSQFVSVAAAMVSSSSSSNTCTANNDCDAGSKGGKVFLTSSGCTTLEMKSVWKTLYEQAVQETGSRTVVYIPTALMNSSGSVAVEEEQARYVAQELGVAASDVSVLELAHMDDAQNALDDASCVYVEQGNTYYVTYHVRRTGLDLAIVKLMAKGGLYAGASAGAILAGRTIQTCEWKNWDDPGHGTEWDLRKTPWKLEGLHLLHEDASVFPHYNSQWEKRVQEMQPKHEEKVIILDEYHAYVQDSNAYQEGHLIPS